MFQARAKMTKSKQTQGKIRSSYSLKKKENINKLTKVKWTQINVFRLNLSGKT